MTEWLQFFGILVPLVAFFGFLYRELKDWRQETRAETKSIREEINGIREEIRQQASRSDRLYEMFIDLIKEKKC
jgi:hypothetical protein